jgi:hypothetical protein
VVEGAVKRGGRENYSIPLEKYHDYHINFIKILPTS